MLVDYAQKLRKEGGGWFAVRRKAGWRWICRELRTCEDMEGLPFDSASSNRAFCEANAPIASSFSPSTERGSTRVRTFPSEFASSEVQPNSDSVHGIARRRLSQRAREDKDGVIVINADYRDAGDYTVGRERECRRVRILSLARSRS